MHLVETHNVSRSYGHVRALHDVSFTLEAGIVGLVGNNGNETYNAGQVHLAQRFTHWLSGQFAYTFSKALGDAGSMARM